jgi:RNA polymerase sigma factor (sigma-70 family)
LPNDHELWKKIVKGDVASFDAFYRENAPRLQAFLRQSVGNLQAAEDIAQETFIQIWNRPNGFQPERGTLRAYLYGIGRKRAAEWWRSQSPREQENKSTASVPHSETASVVRATTRGPTNAAVAAGSRRAILRGTRSDFGRPGRNSQIEIVRSPRSLANNLAKHT